MLKLDLDNYQSLNAAKKFDEIGEVRLFKDSNLFPFLELKFYRGYDESKFNILEGNYK